MFSLMCNGRAQNLHSKGKKTSGPFTCYCFTLSLFIFENKTFITLFIWMNEAFFNVKKAEHNVKQIIFVSKTIIC